MRTLIIVFAAALLLAPGLVTTASARQATLQEKYDAQQRKEHKDSERDSDADERADAARLKLKKARQTRRTMIKNGDDTSDIEEEIERIHRESGLDDDD